MLMFRLFPHKDRFGRLKYSHTTQKWSLHSTARVALRSVHERCRQELAQQNIFFLRQRRVLFLCALVGLFREFFFRGKKPTKCHKKITKRGSSRVT